MRRYKLDLILSIFVIIFSLILIIFIIPNEIKVPTELKGTYLAPSFLPKGYSIFLLIIGIVLLAATLYGRRLILKEEKEEKEKAMIFGIAYLSDKERRDSFFIAIKLWVVFIIFMILMHFIGMLVASIFFMFFIIMYFGNGSKMVAVCVSILVPVALYSFFRFLGDVPVPNGLLFDYFF